MRVESGLHYMSTMRREKDLARCLLTVRQQISLLTLQVQNVRSKGREKDICFIHALLNNADNVLFSHKRQHLLEQSQWVRRSIRGFKITCEKDNRDGGARPLGDEDKGGCP